MNVPAKLVAQRVFLVAIVSASPVEATEVHAWGANTLGQLNIPATLTNAVAISAGAFHNLAIRDDSSVVAWGENKFGESVVPDDLNLISAVAAGWGFSVALSKYGHVQAWGWDVVSTNTPGLENVTAIAAGWDYALALHDNGTVLAWGDGWIGQTNVPSDLSNVVAIAAGGRHCLALKANGTVTMWGDTTSAQQNMPPHLTDIVAIAGGGFHSLALRRDGTVVAWGTNDFGQVTVPMDLSNVVAIAAGQYQSLALKRDGTVVAWGDNSHGQIDIPADATNAGAISGGIGHTLALTGAKVGILQILIDQAMPGDTIRLDPLTYYDNVTINKDLIVQGETGKTVIDGNHRKSVLTIVSNVNVTLTDFTIRRGFAFQRLTSGWDTEGSGGGVYNDGSVKILNCVIRDCDVPVGTGRIFGVAVYNSGTMELDDSVIADSGFVEWSFPDIFGGGIGNVGNLRAWQTVIVGCAGTIGGGIDNGGYMSLQSCIVSNCSVYWDGGGIANYGELSATNTTITGNSGRDCGGFYGEGTLVGCTISKNGSAWYAGGILLGHPGSDPDTNQVLTLINCTVAHNSCAPSSYGIGGIAGNGTIYLFNSTVVSNQGSAEPGPGTSILNLYAQNSIIGGAQDVGFKMNSLGYNIIQHPSATYYPYYPSNFPNYVIPMIISGDLTGNLLEIDPRLGPLQHNGGPTLTYALLSDSPAIDAGLCGVVAMDQRGVARPFDIPGINDSRTGCDIGAFEYDIRPQNSAPTIACPGSLLITNNGHGPIALPLTGISAGSPGEAWQPLTLSASNSDPALVSDLAVNYISPQATGSLSFTLNPLADGIFSVTVLVDDGQETNHLASCTFDVTVVAPPRISLEPTSTTVGLGSSAIFTVSAVGSPPLTYQWRFHGTNLSNAFGVTGSQSATLMLSDVQPAQAGAYSVWVRNGVGSVLSSEAHLSLTGDALATHTGVGYSLGVTSAITCEFKYPADRRLLSLLWRPVLPNGWSLVNATGDGDPQIAFGDILLAGSTTNNPLRFTWFVRNSGGQEGAQSIRSSVEYQLDGMINPASVGALPDPLWLTSFHAADYQDPRGVIDGSEANRVLSYWRALAYHRETEGSDGYAPGTGNTEGPSHTSDYRAPFWQITGSEVNRVLSYWRAHCYRIDPMGLDGYAPGCVARAPPTLSRPLAAQQSETTQAHQGSIVYHPGEVLTVTNRLEYAAPLLSLLLHPQVPTGWDLLWVQGDGNPELIAGEIVWTAGAMPSSPVTVVYGIQVPISSRGPEHVTCDVEYHLIGETNPRTEQLLPDPLLFYWQPSLSMQSGPDNFSLSWQAGDTNFVIEAAESLIAPIEWRPLAELPEIGNDRVFVTVDRASAARYFRLRRKSVELLLLP